MKIIKFLLFILFSLAGLLTSCNDEEGNESDEIPSDGLYVFSINVSSSPNEGGSVKGSGLYEKDEWVTITATPSRGYEFDKWSDSDQSSIRNFYATENVSLVAYFKKIKTSATITDYERDFSYVDLGLSVMWATNNIGGDWPTDYGDCFSWGEVSTKKSYNWESYRWGMYYSLTKYCTSRHYGTVDNKSVLDLTDDVAAVLWGGAWRLPTYAEMKELMDNCTWEWKDNYDGKNIAGQLGTSKINGNTIFFPAAGMCSDEGRFDQTHYGYYWASSLNSDSPINGIDFYVASSHVEIENYVNRSFGLTVRPVFSK